MLPHLSPERWINKSDFTLRRVIPPVRGDLHLKTTFWGALIILYGVTQR